MNASSWELSQESDQMNKDTYSSVLKALRILSFHLVLFWSAQGHNKMHFQNMGSNLQPT